MAKLGILMFALAIFVSLGPCAGTATAQEVSRPIAQSEIDTALSYDQIVAIVRDFSSRHQFAVRESETAPGGLLEFVIDLFRDDVRISVSRMRGDPLDIAGYPLCACVSDRRYGLQEAAEAAVRELAHDLAQ